MNFKYRHPDYNGIVVSIPTKGRAVFNRASFSQCNFHNEATLYDDINDYVSNKLTGTEQLELLNKYIEIYDFMESVTPGSDDDHYVETLSELIAEMYVILDLERIREWSAAYMGYHVPSDLKLEYEEGLVPDKTYLRSEYHGLLFLTTVVKFMSPIWGLYQARYQKIYHKIQKNAVALALLSVSDVPGLPEYRKLEKYVDGSTVEIRISQSATVAGLSAYRLNDYIIAEMLIRRLCIGETSVPTNNLVARLHQVILGFQDEKGQRIHFQTNVDNRTATKDTSEEDNTAYIEAARPRVSVNPERIVDIKNWLTDEAGMAANGKNRYTHSVMRVMGDIDKVKYEDAFNGVSATKLFNMGFMPNRLQLHLVTTFAHTFTDARLLESLNAKSVIPILIMAQAYFHSWGLSNLAAVCTARCKVRPQSPPVISVASIPKELISQLAERYPYWMKKPKIADTKQLTMNPGFLFAMEISNKLGKLIFLPVVPEHLANDSTFPKRVSGGRLTEEVFKMHIKMADVINTLESRTKKS